MVLLEPMRQLHRAKRDLSAECPRIGGGLLRIQTRKIKSIRRRNERLHHEFFPDVIHCGAGKLDVACNQTRNCGSIRFHRSSHRCHLELQSLWNGLPGVITRNAVDGLACRAISCCRIEVVVAGCEIGNDEFGDRLRRVGSRPAAACVFARNMPTNPTCSAGSVLLPIDLPDPDGARRRDTASSRQR